MFDYILTRVFEQQYTFKVRKTVQSSRGISELRISNYGILKFELRLQIQFIARKQEVNCMRCDSVFYICWVNQIYQTMVSASVYEIKSIDSYKSMVPRYLAVLKS